MKVQVESIRTYERIIRTAGFALLLGVAAFSKGQAIGTFQPPPLKRDVGLKVSSAESDSSSYIREIFDQSNGVRWTLRRDEAGSAGPGRMVLTSSPASRAGSLSGEDAPSHKSPERASTALVPVIHAGDKLIVEEHTARVDACLEAVALEPATIGAALRVRLTIGRRIVRAIAQGPSRAAILRGSESRR
jgi:hypothetical protein